MPEVFSFEFYELGRRINDFANVDRPDVSSGSTAGSVTGGLAQGDTITIPSNVELKRVFVSDNDSNFEEVFNVSGEDVSGGSGGDRQLLAGDEAVTIRGLDASGNPQDMVYDPNDGLGVIFDNDYFFVGTAIGPDGEEIPDVRVSFIRLDDTPPPPGETGPHDGEIVGFFTIPFLEPGSTLTLVAGTDGGVSTAYRSIPCFVAGALIATPDGPRRVEEIEPGDLVTTKDRGAQAVRWTGRRTEVGIGPAAPVRIRAGVIGNDRDLFVSPQHRVLLSGWRAEALFGAPEVLVAAIHLLRHDGVGRREGGVVSYHHLLFDEHEIIFAEGAPTESLHPGEIALAGFDAGAHEASRWSGGPAARPVLKAHEARALYA